MNDDPENKVFQNWITDVVDRFTGLTDELRNQTLDALISNSGPGQLVHLHGKLSTLLHMDWMRILPAEVIDKILEYLDAPSIFACTLVDRRWNETVNGNAKMWFRLCRSLGLQLTDKWCARDAVQWRKLYNRMCKVKMDMRKGIAFEDIDSFQPPEHKDRVTATFYYRNKLATASDDGHIHIWNCSNSSLIRTITVESLIASVKFDDKLLVASSYNGTLESWHVQSGSSLQQFRQHLSAVFTFDYCSGLNMLASGGADGTVVLWSLDRAAVLDTLRGDSHWIVTVLLNHGADCLNHKLLVMDEKCILVWSIVVDGLVKATNSIRIDTKHSLPNTPRFITPGLHCVGDLVYFVKQDPKHGPTFDFCCWDISNRVMVSERTLELRVKQLLGVGSKYACILMPQQGKGIHNLIVFLKDVTPLQVVASAYVPHHRPTTPGNSQITLGDTSWLDGLDGHNHRGLMLAVGIDKDVHLLKWKENTDSR